MKKGLVKIGAVTVLMSILAVPSYGQGLVLENNNGNSDYRYRQSIEPYADNIVWKLKKVNGITYKRQYNVTTGQWIGDWIKA